MLPQARVPFLNLMDFIACYVAMVSYPASSFEHECVGVLDAVPCRRYLASLVLGSVGVQENCAGGQFTCPALVYFPFYRLVDQYGRCAHVWTSVVYCVFEWGICDYVCCSVCDPLKSCSWECGCYLQTFVERFVAGVAVGLY